MKRRTFFTSVLALLSKEAPTEAVSEFTYDEDWTKWVEWPKGFTVSTGDYLVDGQPVKVYGRYTFKTLPIWSSPKRSMS